MVSRRYFFPRRVSFEDPFWVDCGDGIQLGCYFHEGHPGSKTLVHFHGNGEVVSDYMGDFVSVIDSMGYNCFLMEYRGYGMSTGRPALVRMFDDVETVIRRIGVPPRNLILFGRSVGSLYAIHGVSRFPNAAALILESAIANPLERILLRIHPSEFGTTLDQVEEAVAREINLPAKLTFFDGPTLILHTKYDGLVDVSHAHLLEGWCSGPTQLKVFDRGDHNSIMYVNSHGYFKTIHRFLADFGV